MTQGELDAWLTYFRRTYETQTVARALYLQGEPALSMCVDCVEKRYGWTHEEMRPAARTFKGGECECCPYVGRDTIVVLDGPWRREG